MSYRLSAPTKKILVVVHILFASIWIGSASALLLISFLYRSFAHDVEVQTIHTVLKWLDDCLIIPSAFGSLFTGLFLSWFTNWGFFVYRWVLWKWIATVSMIAMGAAFLGRWINEMAIRAADGLSALRDSVFLSYAANNRYFVSLQLAVLLFLVTISILKPWGKRQSDTAGAKEARAEK
jgi:hypothetical protein